MIEYMSLRLCAENRERFRRSQMVPRGDSLVVSALRRKPELHSFRFSWDDLAA
jgi:hypothetical protein